MPYEKQNWNDNDPATPISATRLAHMENGIGLIDTHEADPVDAHDASAISVIAYGRNVGTNVQLSLESIEADKARIATTVDLTTNQSIAGIKTYTTSPQVPTPTSGAQATNKTYVDSQVAAGVADESITNIKISPTAAISQSKIANLTTDISARQLTSQKGIAAGYASLDSAALVPTDQLGTSLPAPDATKFLRGDRTWAVPSGGGGSTSDQVVYAAAFGVVGDNSTDSTTALQNAVNSFGTTVTARGGKLQLPKGTIVISGTITIERKALELLGYGWGPTGTADGTTIRWAGAAGVPMIRVSKGMGTVIRDIRLMGSKTSTPSAGIELYVNNTPAQEQPNTFMTFDRIWFGPFTGYDESDLVGAANYLTTGIRTTTANNTLGENLQNDMIRIGGCVFYKCGHAYKVWTTPAPGNTQAVLNRISSCYFYYCGTGIESPAQTMIDNVYFAHTTTVDLHPYQDRFTVFNYTSELSAMMAKLEDNAELVIHTGYFAVWANLNANGRIIEAINQTRNVIDLSFFDFREDAGYAASHPTKPAKICIKMTSGGPEAHKDLGLYHVNYGLGGLREPFNETRLEIDPGTGGGFADTLTIHGEVQGPVGLSGHGRTIEIYNFLNYLNPTASFIRSDRIVPLRVKAGIPADADYYSAPPNGTQVIDSTNNRLYVRVGGVWKYSALT